jgi:hypothetical protein
MVTGAQTTGEVTIMSPSEMTGGNSQSQSPTTGQQSSLETSTDIDGAGPIIGTIRNSRYSETEILLMIDGIALLLFLYLAYKEAGR